MTDTTFFFGETVKKHDGPVYALEVGTWKPHAEHPALKTEGVTVVHDNGYIVGGDVDLDEMVKQVRQQRGGGLPIALGGTEYPE